MEQFPHPDPAAALRQGPFRGNRPREFLAPHFNDSRIAAMTTTTPSAPSSEFLRTLQERGFIHQCTDLATLDEEGFCNIVGRVKDMVIRGGENVYPREIEEFLYRHPKIKEVQVFGVPDARYGEELAAWIVTVPGQTLTEDDVKAFCAEQIAHYKVPRYVRFKDSLPMTVTGKAQKFVMREAMMEELGLTDLRTA